MMGDYFRNSRLNWRQAWQHKSFRYKTFAGILLISIILYYYPLFFQFIEKRKGISLNDVLLERIPAYDVYFLIFILIWSSAICIFLAAIRNPSIFIISLFAYILLSLTRMLTIFLFPLEPPSGLISLTDPLANHFYGVTFITKDLFFSGHVSTVFLIFLCLRDKFCKYFTIVAAIMVSILILVQHIHYFIDILFAFPFAYICYRCAKFFAQYG